MEWQRASSPIAYDEALAFMEARVAAIRVGEAEECVWLLEHPPLYTAGTSAKPADLLDTGGFPVYPTGRGGQYTYHGPGQRIAYVMLDLQARAAARGEKPDLRAYVQALEQWIINTLAAFGVEGFTRDGRIGVWVSTAKGEAKIAALGIRVRRWVSYHGIAINRDPDLSHYRGIIPCGIRDYGVTSLAALGCDASESALDQALKDNCPF